MGILHLHGIITCSNTPSLLRTLHVHRYGNSFLSHRYAVMLAFSHSPPPRVVEIHFILIFITLDSSKPSRLPPFQQICNPPFFPPPAPHVLHLPPPHSLLPSSSRVPEFVHSLDLPTRIYCTVEVQYYCLIIPSNLTMFLPMSNTTFVINFNVSCRRSGSTIYLTRARV